jgi:hypothetical protein
MDILYKSLHQINHYTDSIDEINVAGTSADLLMYVENLLKDIVEKQNKRKFKFESSTTEVRSTIDRYLQNDYANASLINANRLLRIEKQAQENISQLQVEIQKGSLFQAYIQNKESKIIIISKADHSNYLDEMDFALHAGLPWKKRVYKAVIIELDSNDAINNIYVYDTNTSNMSVYWWRDFLELSEVYTDGHNTQQALDLLDRKIFNQMKKDYPADHTYLRNSSINYFRTKSNFAIDDYISDIFENYTPTHSQFPREKYIEKINKLPETWGFDHRFTIAKEEINKRKVTENKIVLTENIELVLIDSIEDLKSTIKSGKDIDGRKHIKIYSESGYEAFKDNET